MVKVHVATLNMHNNYTRVPRLLKWFEEQSYMIMILTEIPGSKAFGRLSENRFIIGVRVAIMVSKELQLLEYNMISSYAIYTVVEIMGKRSSIIALYRTPSRFFDLTSINEVIDQLDGYPVIIVGDFNCESRLWSDEPRNRLMKNELQRLQFSEKIAMLSFRSLFPKDRESGYTFYGNGHQTIIDAILYNDEHRVINRLMEKLDFSDHRLLVATIEIKLRGNDLSKRIRTYKFKSIRKQEDLESTIKDILEQPRIRFTGSKPCRKKTLIGNGFFRLNRIIKEGKAFWGYYRKLISTDSVKLHLNQHINRISFEGIKGTLLDKGFKGVTDEERKMIRRMKFNSSSGYADDFDQNSWKVFFNRNENLIISVIDQVFKRGEIPEMLKISGLTKIPKPDGDFRVIRTQSYMTKIIDKILFMRLLNNHNLDEEIQFAMKGNNCWKAIIRINILINQYKQAVSTDISKAFDRISTDSIINRVKELNDLQTTSLVRSFVTNRKGRVPDKGEYRVVNEGNVNCQGASIGPMNFMMTLMPILRRVERRGAKIIAYADDVVIFTNNWDKSLRLFEALLKQNNLELNRNKTKDLKATNRHETHLGFFMYNK